MDAKINWQNRMTFTASADSGFQLTLGTDPSVGGDNNGFRPMELLAIGLAGCTAMDVISILSKKRQDVTAFEVHLHAGRAEEHPKVFTNAKIEYHVSGHAVDEQAVKRAIELSADRYCPAQAMFKKIIPIDLKYFIYEDFGNNERNYIKSGNLVSTQ